MSLYEQYMEIIFTTHEINISSIVSYAIPFSISLVMVIILYRYYPNYPLEEGVALGAILGIVFFYIRFLGLALSMCNGCGFEESIVFLLQVISRISCIAPLFAFFPAVVFFTFAYIREKIKKDILDVEE